MVRVPWKSPQALFCKKEGGFSKKKMVSVVQESVSVIFKYYG